MTGPTGSGKVQLIKVMPHVDIHHHYSVNMTHLLTSLQGTGQLCGRNILTLHCSPLMSGTPVMRMLEGLAQEGTWACFSDVDSLSAPSLSVLSQMIQIISTALQSNRTTCTLPSTREVNLTAL